MANLYIIRKGKRPKIIRSFSPQSLRGLIADFIIVDGPFRSEDKAVETIKVLEQCNISPDQIAFI